MILALLALTVVTIWIHEAYFFRGPSPQLTRLGPFMPWLAPHIVTGAVALVLGPLQFSTTIRKRSLALHRWVGRAYTAAVLISSPLALYIILTFEAPSARWVMGTMAALWFITTAFAWLAAASHNLTQHKLWVGRSYLFTFTFTMTRFALDVIWPGINGEGVTNYYWVLNVACLVIPDIVLWANATLSSHRASRATIASRRRYERTEVMSASYPTPRAHPSRATRAFVQNLSYTSKAERYSSRPSHGRFRRAPKLWNVMGLIGAAAPKRRDEAPPSETNICWFE
ncbi:MAG: DUF2306 domain-containing protein [Terricaulis sp.]